MMRDEDARALPPAPTRPPRLSAQATTFLSVGLLSVLGFWLRPTFIAGIEVPRGTGLAISLTLLYGPRVWLGALAGAFLPRTVGMVIIGGTISSELVLQNLLIAAFIAAQGVVVTVALRRRFGWPLRLSGLGDVARFCGIAGLLGPIPAALLGVGLSVLFGHAAMRDVPITWLGWWGGDAIGTLVSLPAILLWPSRRASPVIWRGRPLPRFDTASVVYIALSLIVSFAAWKVTGALGTTYAEAQFQTLANDSRRALEYRLGSLNFALQAASGLLGASDTVTSAEWKDFVGSLELKERMPGVMRLGFVVPVSRDGLSAFLARTAAEGIPGLQIHPPVTDDTTDLRVVTLEKRVEGTRSSTGLDVGRDPESRAVLDAARDTGLPQITRTVQLPMDEGGWNSFVVYVPVFQRKMDISTISERRAALRGWVAAPVEFNRLLTGLTASQGEQLALELYDGPQPDPALLAYRSPEIAANAGFAPRHQTIGQIAVDGRIWTVVWKSTHSFDQRMYSGASASTLAGGLAFTGLLAIFLLSLGRREEMVRANVAERTRELALQVEENRSIIRSPIAGIVLLDEAGKILFANDAIARLFGYRDSELAGRPFTWLLGGATADYFDLKPDEAPAPTYRGEVRATSRTGQVLVLDVQINAWMTIDGRRRFTALMNNVTDKRRIEQQLRDTQHRLDIALTGANLGVFDLDLRTGKSIVSATWKALFGIPASDQIDAQAEWRRRVHPDDLPMVEASDMACARGETARSTTEYRARGPKGEWRWMRSDAVVGERDATGRVVRLIGVQTDITELVESKEALRASEDQFRSAIEDAPIGMAIVGLHRRFLQVNAALGAFAGAGQSDLIGKDLLDLLQPTERERFAALIGRLIAGTEKSVEAEAACLRAGGIECWGRWSIAVIRNADGQPLSFVVQLQDTTEQRQLDRIKGEFVATVSHELRTPLTSINGSLGLVLNEVAGPIPEKAARMLAIAQKNCNRLILLVNDILDLEKLTSGQSRFDYVTADVGALVDQALRTTQPMADGFGVALAYDRPAEALPCRVDVNRFQQVMANLISNATKFSPVGGQVEVATRLDGGLIIVSVTDHGSGVPVAFRSKIFTAFSQADSSSTRSKDGTGLGLKISREIVERMGGRIGFESETGKGTTFWFSLPLAAGVAAPAADAGPAPVPKLYRPSILHLEADADFAEIVAAAFQPHATVVSAGRVAEAETLLAERRFDLILADCVLPDGSANGFVDHVLTRYPDLPVVGLTSDDGTAGDPRVSPVFIKSRTTIDAIRSSCLELIARGHRGTDAAE